MENEFTIADCNVKYKKKEIKVHVKFLDMIFQIL